jgi:hypothetical protein
VTATTLRLAQDELLNNIESRKNRVFIMLEEVRRLRVQLQLKNSDVEVGRKRPGGEEGGGEGCEREQT